MAVDTLFKAFIRTLELISFGVTYGIVCAKFAISVTQVSHF